MSNGEYLYPHEIREAWHEVIDQLDLPPEEAGIIASIVEYAQPPLAWEALCTSTEVYSHDHGITINEGIVKKFVTSEYISHSKPKRFATSHPVFFAFTHPAKLGTLSCSTTRYARSLLSNIFYDAASGEMVSRSQFYQHAIAVRDVLISLMASGWQPRNTAQHEISDLLLALHSCRVPDDQIAYRSYPLLAARELLQQFIREQVHGHQAA